jgi:hypothetical protein
MTILFILMINLISIINGYVFPCYYYYEPNGLTPELIPNNLCTHIIILGCVDETNLLVEPLQRPYNCSNAFLKMQKLKEINPKLTLSISIATNEDAINKVVSSEETINNYLDSAIELVKRTNFQGNLVFDLNRSPFYYLKNFIKFIRY